MAGPAPATVQPKRSTAAWSTCAAPPSASATSPTTSHDPYSRQAIQTPTTPCIGEKPLFLGVGQSFDGNRQPV